MKRRDFLTRAAAGAVAGASLAGCTPPVPSGGQPVSGPRVRWRLASSFPPSLDTIYGAGEALAHRVEEITGGAFTINVSAAGEIVPAMQVLDAVQQGTVQAGHSAGYYYIGKNPALAFDTSVPFGLNARQQIAWLLHGGGLEAMREVYADFNIVNFFGGNTGAQMGGWFRREINGVDDLRGLKMRIPGLGGEVMNRLGVSVQVLSGGEIYPALERGAIDATEWVGPYDDEKLGLHKVAEFYYYPGWWEPGPSLTFMVNRDAWAALPPAYQAAFTAAANEAGMGMLNRYDARNPAALQRLLDGGVQLRRYADPILAAARTQFKDVVESTAADDPAYARIYTSWESFRAASAAWFSTTELAFSQFVSE